jgi:hypothetical protein
MPLGTSFNQFHSPPLLATFHFNLTHLFQKDVFISFPNQNFIMYSLSLPSYSQAQPIEVSRFLVGASYKRRSSSLSKTTAHFCYLQFSLFSVQFLFTIYIYIYIYIVSECMWRSKILELDNYMRS